MRYKRHWLALGLVVLCSFIVLISQGIKLHRDLWEGWEGEATVLEVFGQ